MPEWAAPGWLLVALAVAALVWWLHARRDTHVAREVSALYLWRHTPATAQPRAGRGRRDPRWWLRALAAVLLCIAAARPFLAAAPTTRIELWLDDSPAMLTMERNGARAQLAADAVRAALATAGAHEVIAHRLRAPRAAIKLDPRATDRARLVALLSPTAASNGGNGVPPLPAAVMLQPRAQHWLVTAGSDPALVKWLASVPLARIIQVGEASENAAVLRLAVRPSLTQAGTDLALLEVANLGLQPAARSVSLAVAGETLFTTAVTLAPAGAVGDRAVIETALPASRRGLLGARLTPADVLTADDGLIVDTQQLDPVAVTVRGRCSAAVRAALMAHPGLHLASRPRLPPAGPAQLLVACGDAPAAADLPLLWFRTGAGSRAVTGWPAWSAAAGGLANLTLAPQWLREVQAPTAVGETLLRAGERVLVAQRDGLTPLIEVRVDTSDDALVRQREFPALVAGLVERLLGRDTLEPVVVARREASAARVTRATLPPPLPQPATVATAATTRDLTAPLIAAASLALAGDLVLGIGLAPLWRRWRRAAAA